ncbi:MAG TPA: DNA gyrase inhibitor YacG [Kofleriaceae bacterium]|nr:DNA gyrase inhibitor YacG [Kofleriaceae bacterium]
MTRGRCPTCRRAAHKDGNKLWPFCSERCHLVDLGRWLGEDYRIPGEPDASDGAEAAVPAPDDER